MFSFSAHRKLRLDHRSHWELPPHPSVVALSVMIATDLQVADAEAATARLVAHMTESSPNEPQLPTAHRAGEVLSAHDPNGGQQRQQQLQPQQQHSWDEENIPQVQQHAGKRGSNAQSGQAVAAAGVVAGARKQPAKRRKVSKDTPAVYPTAAEGGGSGKADGEAPDAKEVVGRTVQQQFETGIFKVGAQFHDQSDPP